MLRIALILGASLLQAQEARHPNAPAEVVRKVTALDKAMFDAYNTCDLKAFAALFDADFEFYHDQSGLMTGMENLLNATKQNICGKVRRELVPGTMEVYVMRGYGAVQSGSHRFLQQRQGVWKAVGEAKFVHLWREKDGVWRASRVISYDHRGLE